MSNDNMKLWDLVSATDPKFTKKANVKGNNITSIKPQYQIMKATEQFGVYGVKWGFKSISLDYSLIDNGLVVFFGVFFFPSGEFPIINTISIFKDNAKTKVDDDFAKKVETDALTKALSKLGFNADIFMGYYDDVRYISDVTEKFKVIDKDVELIQKAADNNDQKWIADNWNALIVPKWALLNLNLQNKLQGK